MLNRNQLFLSTIDPMAGQLARENGLGVEIAEYCTACNLDDFFPETDASVQKQISGVNHRLLHGPFNELFPCAIDPLARKLAAYRYRQSLSLAERYQAEKVILHGGYNPKLYYPCWYTEQSVLFWKQFLEENPGNYKICLENVLEEEPEMLLSIVRQVDDSRLSLCLDVGHVNAYSKVHVEDWIKSWGEHLCHVHAHNNDGSADTHSALDRGTLNLEAILQSLTHATVTLELPQIGGAIGWLEEKGVLEP